MSLASLLLAAHLALLAQQTQPTVVQQQPDERARLLDLGREELAELRFAAALVAVRAVLAADPADGEARYLEGLALFGACRFEEAIGALESAQDSFPEDPLLHEFLGRAALHLGRLDEACDALLAAVRLAPDDSRTWNHLGAARMRAGRPEDALLAFEAAIALDPSFAVAHFNVGVLKVLGGDAAAGMRHLEEAARLLPDDPDPAQALGDIHREQGDPERAAHWYRQASDRSPRDPRPLLDLAEVAAERGEWDEAEVAWRDACALDDCPEPAFLLLGARLEGRGRLQEALELYARCAALHPDSAQAHGAAAELALDLEELAAARGHLVALLALEGESAGLLGRIVRVSEEMGDAAGAARAFVRLVMVAREEKSAFLQVAELLATSTVDAIRNPRVGHRLARVLVERSGGGDPLAHYVLARAARALGHDAESQASLERALGLLEQGDPVAALLQRELEQGRSRR